MSTFKEKLELASGSIEALLDGATYEEVVAVIGSFLSIAQEYKPDATEQELQELLLEAVAWADEKYKLYDRLDALIKLKPAFEFVDDLLIPLLVEQLLVPLVAGLKK